MIGILSASSRRQLAVWENEGGAGRFSGVGEPAAPPRWTPTYPVIQDEALLHGADIGVTDPHTLRVLQVSLALLIPAFAAMVILWNGSGAQSGP